MVKGGGSGASLAQLRAWFSRLPVLTLWVSYSVSQSQFRLSYGVVVRPKLVEGKLAFTTSPPLLLAHQQGRKVHRSLDLCQHVFS